MKTDLDKVILDLDIVLGRTVMPVHKLLRMGRGAVIELTSGESDQVEIVANGHAFARGQVIVSGSRIQIEVTELLKRPRLVRAMEGGPPPQAPPPQAPPPQAPPPDASPTGGELAA